jgi:hypothetical protein
MGGRLLAASTHSSPQTWIHTLSIKPEILKKQLRNGSPYFPVTGMSNGETYASRKPATIMRDVATMVRRPYIFHITEGNMGDFICMVASP